MEHISMKLLCFALVVFARVSTFAGAVEGAEEPECRCMNETKHPTFRRCECGDGSSLYYKSINNENLNGAKSDCQGRFGGTVVEIGTEEKHNAIKGFLDDDGDSANDFWTGPAYDEDRKCFIWSSTGTPVGNFIKWAPGHPNTPPVGGNLFGVELDNRGPGSALPYRTRANSQNARYICEAKVNS